MEQLTKLPVLVVEDEFISGELLKEVLTQFGYDVTLVENGYEAIEELRSGRFRLVVSDWEMPEFDGIDLCRFIRKRQSNGYVYVILLTSRCGTRNIVQGLDAGADDFLSKPFQPDELRVRLRTAERILALESRDLLIFSLAKIAESRDSDTGAHLERIRQYSRMLTEYLATTDKYRDVVDGEFIQMIFLTSPLHDIGKVGLSDGILKNPNKLTREEFLEMQQHTILGGETLDAVRSMRPDEAFLRMASDIAWGHHEKYDGTGYPRGVSGEDIPLSARIVALADVYDALTSKRVYKPAFSHEKSRAIIIEGSGKHFDPDIVDAFLALEQDFIVTRDILQSDDDHELALQSLTF